MPNVADTIVIPEQTIDRGPEPGIGELIDERMRGMSFPQALPAAPLSPVQRIQDPGAALRALPGAMIAPFRALAPTPAPRAPAAAMNQAAAATLHPVETARRELAGSGTATIPETTVKGAPEQVTDLGDIDQPAGGAARPGVWAPQAPAGPTIFGSVGGGGGKTTPGGMQLVARTTTKSRDVDDAKKEFAIAAKEGEAAATASEQIMKNEAQQGFARAQAATGAAQRAAAEGRALEAQRTGEYNKRVARADAAERDYARSSSIDPDHFWNSRSTGQQLAAIFGMVAGGILQGIRGGENPAMTMINQAIDRDMRAQQQNREHLGKSAEMQRASLGDLLKQHEQQRKSEEEDRARSYKAALAQVDEVAARPDMQEPGMQQRLAQMREQLHEKIGQHDLAAAQFGERVTEEERMRAPTGGGMGALKGAPNTLRLPDGRTVSFQTEDDRKKVAERVTAAADLNATIQRAQQLRGQLTPQFMMQHPVESRTILKELKDMQKTAVYARSTAAGQGQVREGEYPREASSFPFDSLVDPSADSVIANQAAMAKGQVDNIVRAHGGEYVQEGYVMTPQGLRPLALYQGQATSAPSMQTGPAYKVNPVKP